MRICGKLLFIIAAALTGRQRYFFEMGHILFIVMKSDMGAGIYSWLV